MITRGLLGAGVAVISTLLAAGCAVQPRHEASPPAAVRQQEQQQEPAVPVQEQSAPAEPGPQQRVDRMEAASPQPDLLARRAEQYSREIDAILSQRADWSAVRQSGAAPEASQVKWIDPNEFRLGDVAPASNDRHEPPGAHVQPIIQTSPPAANREDSIASLPRNETLSSVAANTPAGETDLPATSAATQPSAVPPTSSSAGVLGEKLAQRIRENPRDVSAHLEFQLLQLLLDEQVPQISALVGLPAEDRELVSAVLDGLSLFRSTLRSDNNMLLSRKIRPLIDMSDRLQSQADLMIPTVLLCSKVEGFGRYEPIDPARFAAGTEHKAIIYCEIANFASNLNDKRMWETRLKQELVLYTEGGVPVWNDKPSSIVDAARVRRHDFFVNKRITLPSSLTIGRYLLKVSIIDEQANRVAESSVPIVIIAN